MLSLLVPVDRVAYCNVAHVLHYLLRDIQLIKEKVDLESRLETEQEYVVNKLMKQVSTTATSPQGTA